MNPFPRLVALISRKPVRSKVVRLALFVGGGAAAGFLYAHFIGCPTGGCPITSNRYIATAYGAMMGYLLGQS